MSLRWISTRSCFVLPESELAFSKCRYAAAVCSLQPQQTLDAALSGAVQLGSARLSGPQTPVATSLRRRNPSLGIPCSALSSFVQVGLHVALAECHCAATVE
eukprot:4748103-Pleurochrysis_carterae.AAC.1